MDEPDSQFPAIAFLVHNDEVVGANVARASIESHALGAVCRPAMKADKEIDAYDQEWQQPFEHALNIGTPISSPGHFAIRKRP